MSSKARHPVHWANGFVGVLMLSPGAVLKSRTQSSVDKTSVLTTNHHLSAPSPPARCSAGVLSTQRKTLYRIFTHARAHTHTPPRAHIYAYFYRVAEEERGRQINQPYSWRSGCLWLRFTSTSSHDMQTETNCFSHVLLIPYSHLLHFTICFFLRYKGHMPTVTCN